MRGAAIAGGLSEFSKVLLLCLLALVVLVGAALAHGEGRDSERAAAPALDFWGVRGTGSLCTTDIHLVRTLLALVCAQTRETWGTCESDAGRHFSGRTMSDTDPADMEDLDCCVFWLRLSPPPRFHHVSRNMFHPSAHHVSRTAHLFLCVALCSSPGGHRAPAQQSCPARARRPGSCAPPGVHRAASSAFRAPCPCVRRCADPSAWAPSVRVAPARTPLRGRTLSPYRCLNGR